MPEPLTYFDVLGLPRRYALDKAELEACYRELSRRWHPDSHARAPAAERVQILQKATDLNEAYRTLRDDHARGAYLLKLHGVDIGAEGPGQPKVDPAFLMDILELREALVEARQARDDDRVRALDEDVRRRAARAQERVAAAFARLEGGDRGALGEVAEQLIAQRYFRRFREEIEAYEETREER